VHLPTKSLSILIVLGLLRRARNPFFFSFFEPRSPLPFLVPRVSRFRLFFSASAFLCLKGLSFIPPFRWSPPPLTLFSLGSSFHRPQTIFDAFVLSLFFQGNPHHNDRLSFLGLVPLKKFSWPARLTLPPWPALRFWFLSGVPLRSKLFSTSRKVSLVNLIVLAHWSTKFV